MKKGLLQDCPKPY